ncbi:MAG: hypothetical protein V1644_02410 [Candidatus Micrarchaeota archaeon]
MQSTALKTKRLKAQASGPIELVVAVIILVASMGLAFMVLQNTQSAQCTDKMKSQMRNIDAIMLDVALGSPSTSREANIELASCGGISVEAIRVVYYDSLSYCGKCPASGGGCWMIEPLYYSKEEQQYFVLRDATTCINMPGKVILSNDITCSEESQALIATNNGCPPSAKPTRQDCGLPPGFTSTSASRLVTLGKEVGETQYKMRVTKDFATAADDPELKVCFLTKRAYSAENSVSG